MSLELGNQFESVMLNVKIWPKKYITLLVNLLFDNDKDFIMLGNM